ncbi:MAG: RnfABCDGE type electron transport complex subunit D [Pirellulaceae bacterium]
MTFRPLQTLAGSPKRLRARLGAKWSVAILLIPPSLFGVYQFGPRAALVLAVSVIGCQLAGALPRWLAGQSVQRFHPGSIVTGLLLGLTLSASTPVYMILVGVLVAQIPGKVRFKRWKRNLFNPAALGRTAVAVLEYIDPSAHAAWNKVDGVTGASALFKDAGGNLRPAMSDVFLGFTRGAIGETSDLILISVGILMLWLVVVKRDAPLAMIFSVPLLVLALPTGADVVGHAPWVMNPTMYLFSSNTLLLAVFFATDPFTTPHTPVGGLLFGIGAATIGVCGRLYTTIPGAEMYGILAMNLAAPGLDHIGRFVARPRRP